MYVVARGRAPYLAPSGRRPAGFTLVEMLVVITIIGILAGLTVPVVFNAIRTARNAAIITEMAAIEKAVDGRVFGDNPANTLGSYLRAEFKKRDWTWPTHPLAWKQFFLRHYADTLFDGP